MFRWMDGLFCMRLLRCFTTFFIPTMDRWYFAPSTVVAYAVVVVVVIIIIISAYIYTPIYESFSLCVCSMDESQANMLPLTFHDKLR